MNKILNKTLILAALAAPLALTSCLDEEMPTDSAAGTQVEKSSDALDKMLNGLTVSLVEYDSYGSSSSSQNDWGYPCQMIIRDVMGEDFPVKVTATNYDYYSYIADGTSMLSHNTYTYYYYSKLINAANSLIAKAGGVTTTANRSYVGVGLAFRAMAYLDLARMFEYRQTGFAIDNEATDVWGLTVPIVTDSTSLQGSRNNPQAPFYTMYRFINNDLNNAETLLADYSRSRTDIPDQSVVYGLKARFWLELATRFDKSANDLSTQLSHENDADGYAALGITTANDCYQKAADYAQRAMTGYTPVTKNEWYNAKTGFNTATSAWMWAARQTDKDNINSWYYTWMGTVNSEADFTLAHYGTYRCIGAKLFSEIAAGDWRKQSWINPDDTSRKPTTDWTDSTYVTVLDSTALASLPDYANLKFHTGSGNLDDYQVCLLCEIPLMRVEEMEYIYLEALAHTSSVAAASAQLQTWTNTYRYDDASYTCAATDMDSFITELIKQKRIELWGEGLVYFDYKRLGLAVKRTYDGTNFSESQRLNSKDGYVAPWMNYVMPEYENAYNPAVIQGPDPSGVVVAE